MDSRRRRIWIAAAAIVVVSGAGAAVAVTQDDPTPTPGKKNSAGCVPTRDGEPVTGPDACGPGNYPMWRFHKDEKGLVSLACGDTVTRGTPPPNPGPVAEGEPDPSCHPMTEADLKKVAELSKKANDDYRNGRNLGVAPVKEPK